MITASIIRRAPAFHDRLDLVEREIDAVVGHTPLREIVGADALGTIARADLVLAGSGARIRDALALHIEEARAQDIHGPRAVLVLRALLLHQHRETRGDMRDAIADSVLFTCCPPAPCERMVSMRRSASLMETSTSSAIGRTATVQRCVDAPLRFRFRHALHAVHTRFEFQPGEGAIAMDFGTISL